MRNRLWVGLASLALVFGGGCENNPTTIEFAKARDSTAAKYADVDNDSEVTKDEMRQFMLGFYRANGLKKMPSGYLCRPDGSRMDFHQATKLMRDYVPKKEVVSSE